MKKRILILILLLIFIILFFLYFYLSRTNLTAEEKTFLKEKGIITFVSQTNYPPFEFTDKNNKQTGITIELARWISTVYGIKAKFLDTDFYNAKQMILDGKADVITTLFYSKERDLKFDFTDTVFEIPASIFVKTDNNNIHNINDLKGKTIAIQKGDFAISYLKNKGINFNLYATNDFVEATKLLLSKKIDAIVGDEQIIIYTIQHNNLFSKIKIAGKPLYNGQSSMAVKEGNKTLISILNKGILKANKTGVIKTIQRKWIGNKLESDFKKYLLLITLIIIGLIFFISLIWAWNILLKRKINERTKELNNALVKLQNSEKKFRGFFESASISYLLLDKNGFIDCNEAAVKMLKAKNKKEILVNPSKLSPKYQPDGQLSEVKAKKIIEEVFNSEKSMSFEWLHKRLTGEIFWAYVSLSLVPYDNRKAILVTWADISEIKRLQKMIIDEKENLEVTLKSIADGVIRVDLYGKVEMMNKVAEKLTGWTLEEAKGQQIDKIYKITNENSQEKILQPVKDVLTTGEEIELANSLLISKNEKKYNISSSYAPIMNKNKQIAGVVLVFRDITENLQKERELLKAEKISSLGVLAGGIAHDFNNLLMGIYGYLSIAKNKISKDHPAYAFIDKAETSIEKTKNLTTQMLTFSKGGNPILGNINIENLIRETVIFNTSGSKIRVEFNFAKNLYKIEADKGQIEQVISNLTINAIQAMKDGGNLYITAENILYSFANKNSQYVKITFRDEGCGIDKDLIDKIFEPYFTTKKSGNGLGLATVYSIITKHNGKIFAESEKGVGTTFTIFLPAVENVNNLSNEKEILDKNDGEKVLINEKLKILIMDDDEVIIELLKDIADLLGHDIEVCKNGSEAVKKYKEAFDKNDEFDVVILDLTIPGGKGGKETIKELLKINPNVKAIVSSGYTEDLILSEYSEHGFKGKLLKPYVIDDMKKEILRVSKL